MMKTIKLFADSIDYEAKELEKLYSVICQEEGRKNYRTKVHSMKSSAGIIGIVPLAGMAKVLEDAARNNDCDVIHQMNPIFLKCWRDYKEHLNVFSDVAVGTKSAKEFWEQVEEIFREIKAAAEEMDIDILDASLKKLEEYRFEGEQAETFENVKTAIINLDVDFLESII